MSVAIQNSLAISSIHSEPSSEQEGSTNTYSSFHRLPRLSASVTNMTEEESLYNSPTVDFGKDFDLILRKCVSERSYKSSRRKCTENVTPSDTLNMASCEQESGAEDRKDSTLQGFVVRVVQKEDPIEEFNKISDNICADETKIIPEGSDQILDVPLTTTKEADDPQTKSTDNTDNYSDIITEQTMDPISHIPSASKTKGHIPKKDIKSKKRKEQGKNKKWKHISVDAFGFDLSLFPWTCPDDTSVTVEMDIELQKFEELCSTSSEGNQDSNSENAEQKANSEHQAIKDIQPLDKTVNMQTVDTDSWDYYFNINYSCHLSFQMNIDAILSKKEFDLTENFSGTIHVHKKLRQKKKWLVQKASKQVKTKHCRQVNNVTHGVRLYIHHRVAKLMPMVIDTYKSFTSLSIRKIDKQWDEFQKSGMVLRFRRPENSAPNPTSAAPSTNKYVPRSKIKRTPAPPAQTLTAYNADGQLGADLVNILINLQNRDVTPEDYDMLLRLDERVKPKTIDKKTIEKMRTDNISKDQAGETCTICMDDYTVGETIKYLPCGHYFHQDCTHGWLQNSTVCPLDGLEISS